MTQNQYLGADIAPLIAAIGTEGFNDAVVMALRQIAANRSQETIHGAGGAGLKRQPHLVGLQEVWEFRCIPAAPELNGYPCTDPSIADAFNDHLAGTLAALGPAIATRATCRTSPSTRFDVYPGIPFFVNGAPAFLQVQDRDVILARSDVATTNVALPCLRYPRTAATSTWTCRSARSVPSNAAFLAVDATINGVGYRFFNTHLEVQGNALIPGEVQAHRPSSSSGRRSPHCRPVGN